jgi:hypothetical protein
MFFGRLVFSLFLAAALVLSGCGDAGPQPIGEAYVGPATLNLREELGPKAVTAATVKHGDKLEILGTRRRFVKVRTDQGVTGWTDGRLLLTPEQMEGLRRMASAAKRLASQGTATVYDPLNMHSEPNRAAPTLYQIPENGKMEVVAHCVEPRVQHLATALPAVAVVKPPAPPPRKPKSRERSSLTPPVPPPPAPPENWLALSRTVSQPSEPVVPPEPKPEPRPVRMDDWDLVRTRDGKIGWVLSHRLRMAIPDEVAQYAEGHRITSYFALSEVHDGALVKHNWLWTTMSRSAQPYEFDRMRVFIWSTRHHRYETAYREKNIKGYYPVTVSAAPGSSPEFFLITEGDDGRFDRTTYRLVGNRVQVVNRMPSAKPEQSPDLRGSAAQKAAAPAAPPRRSWLRREWDSILAWRHRWFK